MANWSWGDRGVAGGEQKYELGVESLFMRAKECSRDATVPRNHQGPCEHTWTIVCYAPCPFLCPSGSGLVS